MGRLVDLTGQKFGRLTVIERAGTSPHGKATWTCECDCGSMVVVIGNSLLTGNTRSCGCVHNEASAENGRNSRDAVRTHGGHKDRLYHVWSDMKRRCENPRFKQFKDYGGRGISVCPEWRNNYEAFREWALLNGYDKTAPVGKCTLDRINVNGNYEPANCRWVDMKAQAQNRRPRDRRLPNERD